eukprot:6179002-Pleurochrysis_carterae.AAC.6
MSLYASELQSHRGQAQRLTQRLHEKRTARSGVASTAFRSPGRLCRCAELSVEDLRRRRSGHHPRGIQGPAAPG